MPKKKRRGCRHYHTWIIAGGYWEWCYECGAVRELRPFGTNSCAPHSTWVRPVGRNGENPYDKLRNMKRNA